MKEDHNGIFQNEKVRTERKRLHFKIESNTRFAESVPSLRPFMSCCRQNTSLKSKELPTGTYEGVRLCHVIAGIFRRSSDV